MILAILSAFATPLGDAVMGNKTSTVAQLLADGADPNGEVSIETSQTSGFWIFKNTTHTTTITTPLHLALEKNRLKIARLLLEAGANPDVVTRHRLPPMHHVAMRGRWLPEQIELLREFGAQAEGAFRGRTALAAVKEGQEEALVDALLANGADVQALACASPAADQALLAEKGADPNGRCGTSSLLHRAASGKELALLAWLLEHGGDPNLAGVVEGREVTPLHLALGAEWTEGVQVLLDAGADPKKTVGVLGRPASVAAVPDHRGMVVRAGAPRIRSDPTELWGLRPVSPGERRDLLEAWALDGMEPPEGWPLPAELRERFPAALAEGQDTIWPQLAATLTPELVVEALEFEDALPCSSLPTTFPELVQTWGPPELREKVDGIKTWRWQHGVAVGRGKEVLEIRGACGDPTLVGRTRAFVWLALGPARGRTVEVRGRLRFYYRDGVVESVGVR